MHETWRRANLSPAVTLEDIYALPRGNPIFPFDTAADMAGILKEQWAGVFQRLLPRNLCTADDQIAHGICSTYVMLLAIYHKCTPWNAVHWSR